MSFEDFASCLDHRKAYIISKGVINGVGGFGVDYEEESFIVNHFVWFPFT
jgi:hypothetical protein